MKTLRVALLVFLIALSVPLSYVLTRTYGGLRQEEVSRLRFFATALFDAMESELAELVLGEENRPVDAYSPPDTGGIQDTGGIRDTGGIHDAAGSTDRTDHGLGALPAEPWLRGYLQNHPDGSFQTPLVTQTTAARERYKELTALNTRFNAIRYQAPKPLAPASLPNQVAAAAEQAPQEKRDKEDGYGDAFLYQTNPSKARSAMARQEVRLEELTATQALKVTRRKMKIPAAEPAPAPADMAESAGGALADRVRDEAEVTDVAAEGGAGTEKDTPRQVEVAPFQALLVDADRAFIFRRILLEGKVYRQGFVLDLAAFSQHLLATHFADQPLARFTQLQLWARTDTSPHLLGTLGKSGASAPLRMERQFPRPFAFLTARLVCSDIPPSSARAPLRLTLIALGTILLAGLLLIYRSVNAQVALSKRRSQFASAVTHELKTPLTTIRMYVEMLAQGMGADPRRQQRYFQVLDAETARLGRLINNVLELSRLEKRQRPLTYGFGDLSEVIDKVTAALGPQLEAAGFEFQVENRLKEPFAYDAEVLVQVLINLVENSLKFGRDNRRKRIRVTIDKQRDTVSLAVRDTGPGIPRGDLKRIFEDFYRAEDEMTRTTSGTGIGLALVQRFAKAMGGGVTARNNPEGGCTITVTIPHKPS
jgi:signal transduction histidine kinase